MKIQNKFDDRGGYFSASTESDTMGQMSYVFTGPRVFVIDHTNVGRAYAGNGVGKALVYAAVDFAREGDYKIIPSCPFARSVFVKNPEICDVLAVEL